MQDESNRMILMIIAGTFLAALLFAAARAADPGAFAHLAGWCG